MTDKDKELLRKILDEYTSDMKGLLDFGNYAFVGVPYENALKAMQAYHEAKMEKVTDEDIERQVKQINRREALCTVDYYSTGFIEGAKAFRDGKIKHKEE